MKRRSEVKFLVELVRRYSPTGRVNEAKSLLVSVLEDYGFKPEALPNGALFVETDGEEPGVLLCSHLDTVSGELPVNFDGRVLAGRGAVDAKSSLAAIICALGRVAGKVRRRLFLVVSVDEEGSSLSTLDAFDRLSGRVCCSIVGEPSRTCGITVSYYGRLSLSVSCEQAAMHESATIRYGNVLERVFDAYFSMKNALTKTFGRMPVAPREVRGCGTGSAELVVNIRFPPEVRHSELTNVIRDKLADIGCIVIPLEVIDPYSINPNNWLVRAIESAIKEEDMSPRLLRKLGTSDMNLIGNILGVPTVAYGPGNPRLSHTSIERVLIDDYLRSIRVLSKALLRIDKVLSGRRPR